MKLRRAHGPCAPIKALQHEGTKAQGAAPLLLLKLDGGFDADTALHAEGRRTVILVHLKGSLNDFSLVFRDALQVVANSNLSDDRLVVHFFDVTLHIGVKLA